MLEEVKKRLNQNLRNLHLPTIRQCYEEQGQLAEKNSSTYEHYLDELVELEVEARRQNRVDRYLRESKLPLEKSWGNCLPLWVDQGDGGVVGSTKD